jgi:hypothetical protein
MSEGGYEQKQKLVEQGTIESLLSPYYISRFCQKKIIEYL